MTDTPHPAPDTTNEQTQWRLSLDEIAYVRTLHGLDTVESLVKATGVSRTTWSRALDPTGDRKPTTAVLQALCALGARPDRILLAVDSISGEDY